MNDGLLADFIVEGEADDGECASVHLTGWEDIVFDLEDDGETP